MTYFVVVQLLCVGWCVVLAVYFAAPMYWLVQGDGCIRITACNALSVTMT